MNDKNKIIDNIQKNIALSNFEGELKSDKDNKEYTHKNNGRIYDMKKMIIAVSCCSIMLIGGFAYAYSSHFKLSNNFLEKDSNYLDIIERSFGNSVENEKEEDKGKFLNGRKFLNGYYIAGKFNQVMGKNTKYEYVHKGIDIVAPRGTKILALANGVIKEANYNSINGNYILIEHEEGYETLYAHLDKISVKEGDDVLQGEEIGTTGATGNVVAPHLHLELHHNGEPVDPMEYIDKIKE